MLLHTAGCASYTRCRCAATPPCVKWRSYFSVCAVCSVCILDVWHCVLNVYKQYEPFDRTINDCVLPCVHHQIKQHYHACIANIRQSKSSSCLLLSHLFKVKVPACVCMQHIIISPHLLLTTLFFTPKDTLHFIHISQSENIQLHHLMNENVKKCLFPSHASQYQHYIFKWSWAGQGGVAGGNSQAAEPLACSKCSPFY